MYISLSLYTYIYIYSMYIRLAVQPLQVPEQDLHPRGGVRGPEARVHGRELHHLRREEGPDRGADRRDALGQPQLQQQEGGRGGGGGRAEGAGARGGPPEAQLPDPRLHGGRQDRLQERPGGQGRVVPVLKGHYVIAYYIILYYTIL